MELIRNAEVALEKFLDQEIGFDGIDKALFRNSEFILNLAKRD